jgi:hypothetical protein
VAATFAATDALALLVRADLGGDVMDHHGSNSPNGGETTDICACQTLELTSGYESVHLTPHMPDSNRLTSTE